jgi:hypothetical protein
MTFSFPCHKAYIGDKISLNLEQVFENTSAPVLNFRKGLYFERFIQQKFGHPVNFFEGPRRREFFLVISFGRSRFRLNIHTVGVVLQACFGGLASLFKVKFLRDRTFKFSVASKSVGFSIYNQSKFADTDYEFFINLWGDGGPNWIFEEKRFYKEQIDSWQTIKHKIPRKSIFDRLKFPNSNSNSIVNKLVPVKTVFERIKDPLNNGLAVKPSFA